MIEANKKNGLLKILSYVLVLAMVLSLAALGTSATDIIDSGTCGDNLTWTLDKDGTLTISGEGEMWDVGGYLDCPPWYCYCDSIVKSIIAKAFVSF